MTEVIQLPSNGSNGNGMGVLPVAGNGGLFGNNGQTSINALQQGNCNLASQLSQCCCDNRLLTTTQGYESQLATERQTGSINGNITAQGQRQVDAIADLKTTMINEFCAARERDMQAIIDKQADEISQLRTKDNINAQTAQILGVIGQRLDPLIAAVKEIQDKQPNTVPVQWPNLQVVNTTPQTGGYYWGGYPYQGGF